MIRFLLVLAVLWFSLQFQVKAQNQALNEYLKTQQSNAEMELRKQQFKDEMAFKRRQLEFEKQKAEFERQYSLRLLELEQQGKPCSGTIDARGPDFSEVSYQKSLSRSQASHPDWAQFQDRILRLSYALAPPDSTEAAYDRYVEGLYLLAKLASDSPLFRAVNNGSSPK